MRPAIAVPRARSHIDSRGTPLEGGTPTARGPAVNYRAHAGGGLRLDAADYRSSAGRAPETTIAARVTRWDKEGESRCERTRESADMPAGGRRRLFFFYLSLDPTTGSPGPGQRAR